MKESINGDLYGKNNDSTVDNLAKLKFLVKFPFSLIDTNLFSRILDFNF